MFKEQIINKYGLEYYNEYKANSRLRINKLYVKEGKYELIENYELAKLDNLIGWDIHHKLELHPDGSIRFTRKSLIYLNLYYNRPPEELIWMKAKDHRSMHAKSKCI